MGKKLHPSGEEKGYKAKNTIDGNISPDWGDNSCWLSAYYETTFIAMELGDSYKIDRVNIWGPDSNCKSYQFQKLYPCNDNFYLIY